MGQWGAFSEYVYVLLDLLSRKPEDITFKQAVSVPTEGLIAVNNLHDQLWSEPGQRVAINGTAGDAMEVLHDLPAAGQPTPVVAKTFHLAEVPLALRYLQESQLCGRIVVVP